MSLVDSAPRILHYPFPPRCLLGRWGASPPCGDTRRPSGEIDSQCFAAPGRTPSLSPSLNSSPCLAISGVGHAARSREPHERTKARAVPAPPGRAHQRSAQPRRTLLFPSRRRRRAPGGPARNCTLEGAHQPRPEVFQPRTGGRGFLPGAEGQSATLTATAWGPRGIPSLLRPKFPRRIAGTTGPSLPGMYC